MNVNPNKPSSRAEYSARQYSHFANNQQQSIDKFQGIYSWSRGLRWLGIGLMYRDIVWMGAPDLGKYGQTELQQVTGNAVQATCGDLASHDYTVAYPLFSTCNAMVQTSVQLDGGTTNGRSLGYICGSTGSWITASRQRRICRIRSIGHGYWIEIGSI